MQISELYDALDGLITDATDNAEQFAEDGELNALATRLGDIGSRAYTVSAAARQIAEALKFEG